MAPGNLIPEPAINNEDNTNVDYPSQGTWTANSLYELVFQSLSLGTTDIRYVTIWPEAV